MRSTLSFPRPTRESTSAWLAQYPGGLRSVHCNECLHQALARITANLGTPQSSGKSPEESLLVVVLERETVDTSRDVVAFRNVHTAPFDHHKTVPRRSIELFNLRGIELGIIRLQAPAKKQTAQDYSRLLPNFHLKRVVDCSKDTQEVDESQLRPVVIWQCAEDRFGPGFFPSPRTGSL